jgi:hypothetical protein
MLLHVPTQRPSTQHQSVGVGSHRSCACAIVGQS